MGNLLVESTPGSSRQVMSQS